MSNTPGSRNRINGFIIGLIILALGCVSLYLVERNAIRKQMKYREGTASVLTVSANEILKENNGKLIYLTGEVKTSNILKDEDFGVEVKAIHLKRGVEMYQWVENMEKTGDQNEKKYRYKKEWKSSLVNSNSFKDTTGHQNPAKIPYTSKWDIADNIALGAFKLDKIFINLLNKEEELDLSALLLHDSIAGFIHGNTLYLGSGNVNEPAIGDMRIRYKAVLPQTVSVIGRQKKNIVDTYVNSSKSKINLLEFGEVSPDVMFAQEVHKNDMMVNIFRVSSFILVFLGIFIFYGWWKEAAQHKRILNRLTSASRFKGSILYALLLSAVTLSFAWSIFNPLTGSIIGFIAFILLIYLFFIQKPAIRAE